MTDGKRLKSAPGCTYRLVSSADAVDTQCAEIRAALDETGGVQAEVTLDELLGGDPYDAVLRAAKVGSRRGKPLLDLYLEGVGRQVEGTGDDDIVAELDARFDRNGADPYRAALTDAPLNAGVDVGASIERRLDRADELTFGEHDLRAALGVAAAQAGVDSRECHGAVVVRTEVPLSDLAERRKTRGLSTTVQALLLAGLDVYVVGPRGGADELETIRAAFRSVARFEVDEVARAEFDRPEAVTAFLDRWYDRLCFDVADGKVNESTIRPASVTAYDLPATDARQHFLGAIVYGLQVAYADKKLNQSEFDRLRAEQIIDHPNYKKYGSRYQDFPTVTIRRQDDRERTFRFSYRGPTATPHVDEVPVHDADLEAAFVDTLKRYLDAEPVDEASWASIVETVRTGFGSDVDLDPELVAESALLHRRRNRTDLPPALPPESGADAERDETTVVTAREPGWYDEHWETILSGYRVPKGTTMIRKKAELCGELEPESTADTALYHKLQDDIENAWQHYRTTLVEQIEDSLPDELGVEIAEEDHDTRVDLTVTVHPPDADPVATTVAVYLPYSDVRVDGESVPKARVANVVSAVLASFEGVLYQRGAGADTDSASLGLAAIRLYCRVVGVESGDVVYFDDVVAFVGSLPGVAEAFRVPNQSVTESVYTRLGDPALVDTLKAEGVRLHLKGSDDHGTVSSHGEQYISMELRDGVP